MPVIHTSTLPKRGNSHATSMDDNDYRKATLQFLTFFVSYLTNEAVYLMKNYGDWGGCWVHLW